MIVILNGAQVNVVLYVDLVDEWDFINLDHFLRIDEVFNEMSEFVWFNEREDEVHGFLLAGKELETLTVRFGV